MTATTMEYKIIDVIPPSEKQENAGIHGTVNLEIVSDGVVLTRMSGVSVRKSKKGDRFLSEPSYPVGEGEQRKWYKHFHLFPGPGGEEGQQQRDSRDALTAEVIRVLDNGGTRRKRNGDENNSSQPAPARQPAANDPWA